MTIENAIARIACVFRKAPLNKHELMNEVGNVRGPIGVAKVLHFAKKFPHSNIRDVLDKHINNPNMYRGNRNKAHNIIWKR